VVVIVVVVVGGGGGGVVEVVEVVCVVVAVDVPVVPVVDVPVVPVVRVVPVVDVPVVPVVRVVPLSGVLFGDACAWAGTTIDSTIGLTHFAGRMIVTTPPTVSISRTRRRVGLLSIIEISPRISPLPDHSNTTRIMRH
jgi:hypothetical protein